MTSFKAKKTTKRDTLIVHLLNMSAKFRLKAHHFWHIIPFPYPYTNARISEASFRGSNQIYGEKLPKGASYPHKNIFIPKF